MLHNLKKNLHAVGASTVPKEAENATFADQKQRLANIEKTMKLGIKAIQDTEKDWKALTQDQLKFSDNFVNLYPDDDDFRSMAKKGQEAAGAVEKVVAEASVANSYSKITKQLELYCSEIDNISKQYKKVNDTKLELELYQKKVQDLEGAKKHDEEKIQRNRDKLSDAKNLYSSTLEGVLAQQKKALDKRQQAFQALFVAYWLAQGIHTNAIGDKYKELETYAKKMEPDMLALNIATMSTEDSTE